MSSSLGVCILCVSHFGTFGAFSLDANTSLFTQGKACQSVCSGMPHLAQSTQQEFPRSSETSEK